MEMEWTFPIARKGKYWREGRRLLDRSFRPGATTSHRRLIEERTRVFLGQCLPLRSNFANTSICWSCCHIISIVTVTGNRSLQGKIIMHLTYGYDMKADDDILIPAKRNGEIMSQFVLPGAALVNHLPFRAFP